MNITTIIELENREVEEMVGAKMILAQEQLNEQIVETCVQGFQINDTGETVDTEDAIQIVFNTLKQKKRIPDHIVDFSFEMPSCERMIKKTNLETNFPQTVTITFEQ